MLLINAVKDVAQALGDLISATKNASGKERRDPSMETLKDNAKVNTNAQSFNSYDIILIYNDLVLMLLYLDNGNQCHFLLKTVKTVEDEAARGTRALESSIEAIRQELKVSIRVVLTGGGLILTV